MIILYAILRLTRLDSSLLGFLAIFLPFLVRTNNLELSFGMAIPLLFICICTFIANDIEDVEKDRINHPDRPLPSGHLTPKFAVILYFTFLGLALFSTKYYVASGIDFLYYTLISLTISYDYMVEYFPVFKPPYVAIAASIPIIIVVASYPNEMKLYYVAGSAFFLTLGRELFMDIKDRPGDIVSFMHRLNPTRLAVAAFFLEIVGLFLLVVIINKLGDIIDLLVMVILLTLSGVCWFRLKSYKAAIILMKIQFFIGLYFLI